MQGAVLLFTLISLVIMLIGAVALIRSFSTALGTAGNLAFKRDLQNQAERVVPTVLALMQTGALSNATARADHVVARNYRASILPSNAQGIPNALLDNSTDDAVFATVGSVANDVELQTERIKIRYLIDRQCRNTGEEALLGADNCMVSISSAAPAGGSSSSMDRAEFSSPGAATAASAAGAAAAAAASTAAGAGGVPPQVVYRLSIRITGPRDTQAYFQTTFTL
jgi:type IV pilus assembly protein PilX